MSPNGNTFATTPPALLRDTRAAQLQTVTMRDAGTMKHTPTSWTDTLKATALAALAEHTVAARRMCIDLPWSWNTHDVWLTRTRKPRKAAAQRTMCGSWTTSTPSASTRT